jgi:hypothetical protein
MSIDADTEEARLARALEEVPKGSIVVALTAVAIVFAIWFWFYFFIFLPRGPVA